MKALRTAVAIVGAVASVVQFIPGPWQGPAAIVAAAAAVASTALAIIDKAKPPSQTGVPTSFDASGEGPIPYRMGRTGGAGPIVYWKEHGSPGDNPNDRQTFVCVLSGAGPIQEVESFLSDQATVTFNGIGAATGYYANYMWQKTQLGLTPSTHLTVASGDGSPPPGWTSAHLLSGYAAAIWTLRFDAKKGKYYQNGTPKPLWVTKGVKVYDPRQDSTFPGGSGPCRAGVESTYVWAGVDPDMPAGENPFLQGLTWAIGRFANGKRILGIGALLLAIDMPAFAEGANVADANGWKMGGIAYSTDNKWDTLVNILQAGGGEPIALGAKISCFVNAPKVALDTIRVGDLSGPASVTATKPRRDRINTIIPRCRLEEQFWEMTTLAPVQVTDYLEVDGGPRSKEVAYPFCQSTKQAAELARYDIENAREFEPISLQLRPRWMGYKPGDCLTAILPEVGLNGHKILLTQRTVDPGSGLPVISARSETDAKHAFALGQTTVAPPTPSVAVRVDVPPPGEDAWEITATSISADSTVQPAIVIEGASDDPNADGIVFEYRSYAAGAGDDDNWLAAGVEPATTLRKVIPGLPSGASIEVGISYREQGRFGERLILGPVTVGSLAVPGTATGAHTIKTRTVLYPVTSGDTSITIAAFSGVLDDATTVSFPAGSITGLSSGLTYGVFYSLVTSTYSAQPHPALTSMANRDLVFIEWPTTSTAGVFPASPTPPGGWGGGSGIPQQTNI